MSFRRRCAALSSMPEPWRLRNLWPAPGPQAACRPDACQRLHWISIRTRDQGVRAPRRVQITITPHPEPCRRYSVGSSAAVR